MKSNILLDPDCSRILQTELRAIFYKALSLRRNNHFIDFIIRFYSLLFAITPVLFRFADVHAMNNMRMGYGIWDMGYGIGFWITSQQTMAMTPSRHDDDTGLILLMMFFCFVSRYHV